MFQSIKYLNYTYDNKTNSYHFRYEITDSDFVSTQVVTAAATFPAAGASAVAWTPAFVIKEYESRKYDHKEIIGNLFLLNMFLLKDNWGFKDLNQILEYQHEYLIKEYCPESNFNEKYYDELVKYTNKMLSLF